MFVRVQVPLRVLMRKDQVFKPGFFVSNRIVKLAFKRLEETKKIQTCNGCVFFLTSFGQGLAVRQFPQHLLLNTLKFEETKNSRRVTAVSFF